MVARLVRHVRDLDRRCPPGAEDDCVTDSSFDALAAAHSRSLAAVSSDVAPAIRAEAAGRT